MFFQTMSQLGDTIKGIIEITDGSVKVLNPSRIRGGLIQRLTYTAVFHPKPQMRGTARWLIKSIAPTVGVHLSSIHPLYQAIGHGSVGGFTVPAINVRGMAYDTACAIFRAANAHAVGALILELAKSEMGYTHQSPAEYAAVVTAAAIQEGFSGPLFIQGDHFQASAKAYQADPKKEVDGLRMLIREAVTAGFLNIDIDSSTLVDLSRPTLTTQQRDNYEVAALLTAEVRAVQPSGITVSVGGEIGEVGAKNSTVEEFVAFMDGFRERLNAQSATPPIGISKISVQTGTSHGGVPMPDGTVAQVNLDFDVLEGISRVAREKYGLAGAVQHGASTLPPEVFDRFPKTGTAEIHLATEFQNMLYATIPDTLKAQMYAYLHKTCQNEMKAGQTEEQFIYKTRKKALGPFKKALWDLPVDVRTRIGTALEEKFSFLFKKLNVVETASLVRQAVPIVGVTFALRNEIAAAEAEAALGRQSATPEADNPAAD